jgi:hypothetical protein
MRAIGRTRDYCTYGHLRPAVINAAMKTTCSNVRSSNGVTPLPPIVKRWRAARAFAGNKAISITARQAADQKILETLLELNDGRELPIGLRVQAFIEQ